MSVPQRFVRSRWDHDRYRMEDEAVRLGAIAYLRKPFDEQYLLDAIELACEKGKERDRFDDHQF